MSKDKIIGSGRMSWNYRVIEFVELDDTPYRQIHEVHYDENKELVSYSEDAAIVLWEPSNNEDPLKILEKMKEALSKDVLIESNFK